MQKKKEILKYECFNYIIFKKFLTQKLNYKLNFMIFFISLKVPELLFLKYIDNVVATQIIFLFFIKIFKIIILYPYILNNNR